VIAEPELGDRRFCIQRAETSCGSVVRGHSSPNRQGDRGRKSETIHQSLGIDTHLVYVYHIDEGLGVIPRKVSGCLNPITVREDCSNQRDALARGEGISDQSFPDRRV